MPQSEPGVRVVYDLHGVDGQFEGTEVGWPWQVPRVGESVAAGERDGHYEVVDVLWHVGDGGHEAVTVTARELDWGDSVREALLGISLAEARRVIELMGLIDWGGEDGSGDVMATSRALGLDPGDDRWVMLYNALSDWPEVREKGLGSEGLLRLVANLLPAVHGAPPEMDEALGALLRASQAVMRCDAPGVLAAIGRRWREELSAAAWQVNLDRLRLRGNRQRAGANR